VDDGCVRGSRCSTSLAFDLHLYLTCGAVQQSERLTAATRNQHGCDLGDAIFFKRNSSGLRCPKTTHIGLDRWHKNENDPIFSRPPRFGDLILNFIGYVPSSLWNVGYYSSLLKWLQ
jgi:hypothetical protein